MIAVIVFLLVIGGVFNSLEKCNLMKYMLDRITSRFGQKRYQLLAVITLFFMALGSFIGSFEECIPLVPIVVVLAVSLGWDPLTGVGMSLLAVGCGFAAGVCNPFTIGVAQELAGLPMFSGIWFRALAFVLIMNFFIPSGSDKAFLLIPLIVPVAQVFRMYAQLCVQAFALDVFQKTLGRALCDLPLFLLFFNILNRHAMRTAKRPAVEDHNPLPIF